MYEIIVLQSEDLIRFLGPKLDYWDSDLCHYWLLLQTLDWTRSWLRIEQRSHGFEPGPWTFEGPAFDPRTCRQTRARPTCSGWPWAWCPRPRTLGPRSRLRPREMPNSPSTRSQSFQGCFQSGNRIGHCYCFFSTQYWTQSYCFIFYTLETFDTQLIIWTF